MNIYEMRTRVKIVCSYYSYAKKRFSIILLYSRQYAHYQRKCWFENKII